MPRSAREQLKAGGGVGPQTGSLVDNPLHHAAARRGPPPRAGEDMLDVGEDLPDAGATEAFGARLAAVVRVGDVIALRGDLGAGKTSLARGLLAALGLVGEAPSPSFAIVQPYAPPEVRLPVLHIDLYRIDEAAEIEELGLDEARSDSVLVVEWPERAGEGYWPDALVLTIEAVAGGGRRLTALVPEAWEPRWPI